MYAWKTQQLQRQVGLSLGKLQLCGDPLHFDTTTLRSSKNFFQKNRLSWLLGISAFVLVQQRPKYMNALVSFPGYTYI